MAISKADLETIQTVFGVTPEELSGALTSDEEVPLSLKLPGKVYKPDEIDQLKTTSQEAGIEIGYKKVAKAASVNLEAGEKDPAVIATKLKSGIEKTLEEKYKNPNPSQEMKEIQKKLDAAEDKYNVLLGTHNSTSEELNKAKEDYTGLQNQITAEKRDNSILSHFPEKLGMDRADALLITKSILETKVVEEKGEKVEQHYVDGKLITDPLGNPAPLKDAVSEVIDLKGWLKTPGKGGGDDTPVSGSMPDNLDDDKAMEYIKKQGIEPMSNEGALMMAELTKNQAQN